MRQGQRRETTLYDIAKAIEGKNLFESCGLGLKQCNHENPCPIHDQFEPLRSEFTQMLKGRYIQELAESVGVGETFLKP